jgi:hypothetical protein
MTQGTQVTQIPVEAVEPPDCYVRAVQLAAHVELIRTEMGRPAEHRAHAVVSGASPREVWFQALAAFRKSDRLAHEICHDPTAEVPHAPPISTIKPGHVLQVLDAAGRELEEIMTSLGIRERANPQPRDPKKTPSDVFGALVSMNRQINLLLARSFQPADCFQQVSLAVAFAARLTGKPAPEPAAFERAKRPADCYQRLVRCLELARALVRGHGQPVIETTPALDSDTVLPSDVYDMASLVLGEVAYLHSLKPDTNPPYPFEGNIPGRKLPSHVWQLVGVLEQQLQQLGK